MPLQNTAKVSRTAGAGVNLARHARQPAGELYKSYAKCHAEP